MDLRIFTQNANITLPKKRFNFLDQGRSFKKVHIANKGSHLSQRVCGIDITAVSNNNINNKGRQADYLRPSAPDVGEKNETQIKQHRHPPCPSLALLCSGGCTQNLFFLFLESIEKNRASSLESLIPFSISLECFVTLSLFSPGFKIHHD